MAEGTPQDTMFIDMKYIILYRKLGFNEVEPDIFKKQYGDFKVTIESENQRFSFGKSWYDLKTYEDMVLIECINRLLEKGYNYNEVLITQTKDIELYQDNDLFCTITMAEWGNSFKEKVEEYDHTSSIVAIFYTSRLKGGLIEYRERAFVGNKTFNSGFFNQVVSKFKPIYRNIDLDNYVEHDNFIRSNTRLAEYKGNDRLVIIPNGIKRIGTGAFWNNTSVEEVIIPDGVEVIEGDAFIYCENLKKIEVPKSVLEMGDNPFAGCPLLKVECLSDHFVMENGVLFDKGRVTLIHYTPSKPDRYYTIPNTVEWLGKHSFYKCRNLERVVITENVSFMGNNAFSDCSNIRLINHSPYFKYINGLLYNADMTQLYHYSMGSNIKHVKIEEGTRTIGRNVFWNATQIETITIPSTVRQIGYNPFANCMNVRFINHSPNYQVVDGVLYTSDLTELVCCTDIVASQGVELPNTLIRIGRNAFVGCKSLNEIVMPDNVQFISRGAFSGCQELKRVNLSKNIEEIGDWAFNDCISLKEIHIPNNVHIQQNTFKNCPAKVWTE